MLGSILLVLHTQQYALIIFTGRRLAELELYLLLSKFISKFYFSTDVQELELTHKTVITTDKPVKMKMIERTRS